MASGHHFIDNEIPSLLNKRAVTQFIYEPGEFLFPIFLCEKRKNTENCFYEVSSNSLTMTISLTPEKAHKVEHACEKLLNVLHPLYVRYPKYQGY